MQQLTMKTECTKISMAIVLYYDSLAVTVSYSLFTWRLWAKA